VSVSVSAFRVRERVLVRQCAQILMSNAVCIQICRGT